MNDRCGYTNVFKVLNERAVRRYCFASFGSLTLCFLLNANEKFFKNFR